MIDMNSEQKQKPPYSVLAKVYDAIMEEVDYGAWADFIDEIIQLHNPGSQTILELASGTGTLALSLDELGYYQITGTDVSEEMIERARRKAKAQHSSVRFRQMDFLQIDLDKTFDVVLSTFDSVNYLHRPEDLHRLFGEIKKVISPGSIFIFDFTTPRNSINAIQYLNNEEGYTRDEQYRFFRKSSYDPNQKIHYNEFRIEKLEANRESVNEQYFEEHEQKIYSLKEMLDIISETDYKVLAAYEDFELREADNRSLRITMVLRCPTIQ